MKTNQSGTIGLLILASTLSAACQQSNTGGSEEVAVGSVGQALTGGVSVSNECQYYETNNATLGYGLAQYKTVATADDLLNMFDGDPGNGEAVPGDLIELAADTVYSIPSPLGISTQASASSRIVLCGPVSAALTMPMSSAIIRMTNASYIVLAGFQIDGGPVTLDANGAVTGAAADRGVELKSSNNIIVSSLSLHTFGKRAVYVTDTNGTGCSGNTIIQNRITDTGMSFDSYTIDVLTGCNNNTVVENTIVNASKAAIHVQGSGNTVARNLINLDASHGDPNPLFAWVDGGNNNVIQDNIVSHVGLVQGARSASVGFLSAGTGNSFTGNRGTLDSSGAFFSLAAGDTQSGNLVGRLYRGMEGYAEAQGVEQWRYQSTDGTTYTDMIMDTTTWSTHKWRIPGVSATIERDEMYPATASTSQVVRVWQAPSAGSVSIGGIASLTGTGAAALGKAELEIRQVSGSTSTTLLGPVTLDFDAGNDTISMAVADRVSVAADDQNQVHRTTADVGKREDDLVA